MTLCYSVFGRPGNLVEFADKVRRKGISESAWVAVERKDSSVGDSDGYTREEDYVVSVVAGSVEMLVGSFESSVSYISGCGDLRESYFMNSKNDDRPYHERVKARAVAAARKLNSMGLADIDVDSFRLPFHVKSGLDKLESNERSYVASRQAAV